MDLSFDFLSAVFFAGIFLTLALIALLSPRENSAESGQDADSTDIRARQNKPKPDLTSNAYRIWLANKYKITKNELFEKYECREELFDTLDDALSFAHDLESAPTSAEEIYKRQTDEQKEQEDLAENDNPLLVLLWVIAGISAIGAVASFHIF